MNDVNNRIFREFTEFFDNVEKSASEISVKTALFRCHLILV